MPHLYLNTGQILCYATDGAEIDCTGSGQDGEEAPGIPWPEPRFHGAGEVVRDALTELMWTTKANFTEFPVDWLEALDTVRRMNRESYAGHRDWRLPNRRELRSLISYQTRDPALPRPHPFQDVQEAYWSSTSSGFEPDWCMALYMYKGAVGVGQKKDENFSVWAVSRED
jgi:hypothetical protein